MATTLVGAMVAGKANFLTVAWLSRVNWKPPMIGIAIQKARYTRKGIEENRTYSVCFPTVEMKDITDYCGVVSGRKVDKSRLFDLFFGELKTAPMIETCPINIECRLIRTVELPTHDLFIGEIVTAYCEERFLTDGKPDIRKIDPLLLTMMDNRYWAFGEQVGSAWKDGLKFNPEK
jgi:flavin reductase (DIM6/NTAB) family NADH-FMN oxidoreductase RutF